MSVYLGTPRDSRRVLVWTGVFEPGYKGGGPIKSLVETMEHLRNDVQCLIVTADRDLGDTHPYPQLSGEIVARERHWVFYFNRRAPQHWLKLLRLIRANPVDLLFVNSFWSPLFSVVPIVAFRFGLVKARGVLIAPRGELSPGALSLKARKKHLAIKLWGPFLRTLRPLFQVSTDKEAAEVSAVLPWADAIIQINSKGPEPRASAVPANARAHFVFISRISPKKNLALALAALQRAHVPATLDIIGPIEDNTYWAECTALMAALPQHVEARYLGPLPPDRVANSLAHYDALLFPTLGENFGHVIVESLAAGCPVICSDRTPWNGVLEAGGGVVVRSMEAQAWVEQIDQIAALPQTTRTQRKVAALDAYIDWRTNVTLRPALETALDRFGGPTSPPN